ncbi:MAG: phosphoribosylpyrophosphate synthetase [Nitrospira sp.]
MSVTSYTNMTEVLQELRHRGFTTNFEFLDEAFRDVDSGKTFTADELTIVEHYRFEGASDPDDMSIAYAIESQDGTRGIVADAFGVYANPDLGGFLNNVLFRERL